jgi:hypothetical protein
MSLGTLTTTTTDNTGIIYTNGTTIGDGIYINSGYNMENYNFNYETAEFLELDEKLQSLLSTSYKEIVDNYICFLVYIDGKNVKPIDDILLMINKKETFNLKIERIGYNIFINNVRFIKIKNLIESSAKEYIKVEFEYDSMEYHNVLKNILEKRSDKLELLKHKIDKK